MNLNPTEIETRLHSSRMRTARALTVSRRGGVLSPRGVYLVRGVYLFLGGALSPRGVYLVLGGVWSGGGCLVWGGVWSGGVWSQGGCLVPGGVSGIPPPGPDTPCEQNS